MIHFLALLGVILLSIVIIAIALVIVVSVVAVLYGIYSLIKSGKNEES